MMISNKKEQDIFILTDIWSVSTQLTSSAALNQIFQIWGLNLKKVSPVNGLN